MNCGTYTECKIKNWGFEHFGFFEISDCFFRKCFGFFGAFVKEDYEGFRVFCFFDPCDFSARSTNRNQGHEHPNLT